MATRKPGQPAARLRAPAEVVRLGGRRPRARHRQDLAEWVAIRTCRKLAPRPRPVAEGHYGLGVNRAAQILPRPSA